VFFAIFPSGSHPDKGETLFRSYLKVLFLTGVLSLGAFARAGEDLGQKWRPAIETLIGQGVTQIGDFDLREFQEKAHKIRWATFSGTSDLNLDLVGNRRSAFFKTKTMEVRVSDHLPTGLKESLPLLELHEALGATGYNDQNYSLSTALQFLSQLPKDSRRNQIIYSYDKEIFGNAHMNSSGDQGSGTSVGGGGDLTAIAVKYAVLKSVVKKYRNVSIAFLSQYPLIGFEPFYEKNQQFVALRYHTRPGYELISVYVPALTWNRQASKRSALVNEVLGMITEIFPVGPNVPLSKVASLSCGVGPVGLFPKATLATTLVIQSARVNFLTGCEKMMADIEVRSPAFKLQSEILQEQKGGKNVDSSHHSYFCKINFGKDSLEHVFNVTKGLPVPGLSSWTTFVNRRGNSMYADTMFQLNVVVNPKGRLTQMFVTMTDFKTKKEVFNEAAGFAPGDALKARFRIKEGKTLQIQCKKGVS
jgi:hypothetical protein